jgi:hypothetical protein
VPRQYTPRVSLTCRACGASFSRTPYRARLSAGYCSRACNGIARTGKPRRSLSDRFWEKVRRGPGCWEWIGSRKNGQYGFLTMRIPGARVALLAHRASWELHFGPIPRGLFVCHRCDNPCCVRPDHLFLGTPADNQADMVRKGRSCAGDRHPSRIHPGYTRRNDTHPMRKIDSSTVREIRRLKAAGVVQRRIAEQFGMSPSQISNIVRGAHWKGI